MFTSSVSTQQSTHKFSFVKTNSRRQQSNWQTTPMTAVKVGEPETMDVFPAYRIEFVPWSMITPIIEYDALTGDRTQYPTQIVQCKHRTT